MPQNILEKFEGVWRQKHVHATTQTYINEREMRMTMNVLEKAVQAKIVKAITKKYGADAWLYKVHGGPYARSGVPDLLLCVHGRFIALEVKRPSSGRVSKLQEIETKKINAAGGMALVVTSADDALDWIECALRTTGYVAT